MKSSHIHVALIVDGNGITGACNTIRSIFSTSKAISVNIIDLGMSAPHAKLLQEISNQIRIITPLAESHTWLENFSLRGFPHVSRAAYAKLLLHRLINDVEKVIYLDTDTLVLADLFDLFSIDLGTNFLGATWTHTQVEAGRLRLNLRQRYFNSGVMLCNLKAWRDNVVEDQFTEWYLLNKSKMKFNDQEILNGVFDGRNLEIGKRWNVSQTEVFGTDQLISIDVDDIAILHFNGAKKYWHPGYEETVLGNIELFASIKRRFQEPTATLS